ncbi:MAG: hypothetical protein AAF570_08280 [Bacteroidota bacterium]
MKARTKSILALAGTLILGMVLGGLIASQVIRSHIQEFKALREPGGFRKQLVRVIEPTKDQKPQVKAILKEFGQKTHEMHREHMQAFHAHFLQLRERLSEVLTPAQLDRVEKQIKRMEGRHKHRMQKRHEKRMRDRNNKRKDKRMNKRKRQRDGNESLDGGIHNTKFETQ